MNYVFYKMKWWRYSLVFILILVWIFASIPQIFHFPPEIKQAQAALPTFVASGNQASGAGTITPALPAGIVVNDILLLFVETANENVSITNVAGGTWAQVTNSPQGTGVAGSTDATRLTVFWSRYNGTQTAPTVGDSGNHAIGIMIAVRGVITSGNPWDVTAGSVDTFADTSGSIPGTITTVADTFVVAAITTNMPDVNSTAAFSGWINTTLTNVIERVDVSRNAGNGGGMGIATGEKASAGSYGVTSVTTVEIGVQGLISIALKPEPPPSNNPPTTPALSETPTFPNEQTPDTTPVLGNFSSTDPEGDAIEYEIQWDEDFNFGTPVTKTSSNFPGDAGWTAATFPSGSATFYTIQPADALTNGQIYWWRVRARDPAGSNTWSSYSEKRSITIDTALTQDRWLQTTGDQFNTGVLNNTETTAGEIKIIGW